MFADPHSSLTLGAAALAGLAGSGHCISMCGGLAGALGMRLRAQESMRARVAHGVIMHLARIGSYAVLGAVAGAVVSSLAIAASDVQSAARLLRALAGLVILGVALRIATRINVFAALERAGFALWSRLAPRARAAARRPGFIDSLALGALWGWLPCGLVYSMALFAASAGDAASGAATLALFGIGTAPVMLGGTLLAARIARIFERPATQWALAALLTAFGAWTMIAAFASSPHVHHH